MPKQRVVVIGSGFGGLFTAKALRDADVAVTLISKTSHHLFQPLLYQVATGILSEGSIAPATREVSYFAPCHQRQQGIGQPWLDLLRLLPQTHPERLGDGFDCCGQGGPMGFKKDYHETSLKIGARLIDKIRAAAPGHLTTDCLSCRIQFQQVLPVEVSHPVELLWDAYRRHRPVSAPAVAA